MKSQKSIQINTRFFSAIDTLKQIGAIETKKEFCVKYNIDPGNLNRLMREPHRQFELAYLNYLVEDYGISADWLLTGRGAMFKVIKPEAPNSKVPKSVPA